MYKKERTITGHISNNNLSEMKMEQIELELLSHWNIFR